MAEAAKKLAGKYESPEALEKAYLELEATLGKQGTELGELKKNFTTYQQWAEKVTPIVEWYGKHADKVSTWVQKGMPLDAQPATTAQPSTAEATTAARTAAASTPGYEWLTPQEKQALVAEIRDGIMTQALAPWQEKFATDARGYAKQVADQLAQQHRSFTDVLWRTFERVIPKDKLDEAKAWHAASLRFADPSKIDPMEMGQEFVGLSSENASLKAQLEEFKKKQQDYEKSQVTGLFGGPSPDTVTGTDTTAPEGRDDRFKAVMNDVLTTHGAEGARSLFDAPSLAR